MNLLALIKWLGKLSKFSCLQRIHAGLNIKASIVMQRLQRETRLLLLQPLLAYNEFTRRLKMSQSSFGFAQETIFNV